MSKKEPPNDASAPNKRMSRYSCPMCKSDAYSTVAKSLYQCSGCKFSFTDPNRFLTRGPGDDPAK